MDRLKVQGNTPNSFLEFVKLFTNQYTSLDDKNIAQGKLHKLQQCGSVQEYIIAYNNIVVALPEVAEEDAIYAFVYSLKPHFKGFVKG